MKVYRLLVRVMLTLAVVFGVAVHEGVLAQPSTPVATPLASPAANVPTEDQLRKAGVNELGVVPIIMYHTFTSDRANTTDWTRSFDGFRQQLQQLYDLGFVTIPMRDLLTNQIDVPLGKHPVVLTFDDASASQFLIDEAADGSITPRANSAVGVLEAFFAKHPDFGHSATFAVVPNYCFSDADIDEVNSYRTCDAKIKWLADRGYEIANHTMDHTNLGTVTVEGFVDEVGATTQWIDERVTGPANLSRVLVLPYGGRPSPGSSVDKVLNGWFRYDGVDYYLDAIVDVAGGPMYSPSSTWFDPGKITRLNSDPASFDYLVELASGSTTTVYTSDGNPDTVTVPNPVPDYLANEFDASAIKDSGKRLVRYDTDQGQQLGTPSAGSPPVVAGEPQPQQPDRRHGAKPTAGNDLQVGGKAATTDAGVRVREEPGSDGSILEELAAKETVTIIGGPEMIDGAAWWQVRTADGTVGWVVETFLAATP